MIDTKQKILDAAERLIAERGYAATSLRQIIAEAGVNLASVHYHFGSKEELLDELIHRKVSPVNEKRLALLAEAEAKATPGPVPLERVIEAFLSPVAAAANKDPQFIRLMGRVLGDGLMPGIAQKHFRQVGERFFAEIRRSLPDLPEEEFVWRRHFLIGAMAYAMTCEHPGLTGGFETRIGYLVRFLVAGFEAPALQPAELTT